MKIGVIADTHLKRPTSDLEKILDNSFLGVDLIVHAGDFSTEEVLEVFSGRDLVAVKGNNDSARLKRRLPDSAAFRVGGFRIGVIHGWGPPFGLRTRILSRIPDVDCLIYGHSHLGFAGYRRGVFFFNPGAFCGGLSALGRKSVGILEVGAGIRGELIRV